MTMAEIIKSLRLKNNMTQEELGKHLGIQKSAIRKYESGLVENIPRSSILKMATLFGVKPSYIMGFEEENEQTTPSENKNVFISYRGAPEGRARTGARYFPLNFQEPLIRVTEQGTSYGKALPQEQTFKMKSTRRNTITVLNLCNSKTKKLCKKISKLDDSDLDKTVGFVEGLLAADKYQKSDENNK